MRSLAGFNLEIAGGMTYRHIVTLGMVASIGFTVALFVSTVAFPPGESLDAVKMGALASFVAAGLAIAGGRMLGIQPLGMEPAIGSVTGEVALATQTTTSDAANEVSDSCPA